MSSGSINHLALDVAEHPAAGEPNLSAQWARVRGRLKSEVGDTEYRAWLRHVALVGIDGDEVTMRLPTRFLRDWVRSHYG